MSQKDDFLTALDESLPEALRDLVLTPIPEVAAIPYPTTVEDAIIAQGQFACNVNEVLRALKGLPIVALALHIGQRNRTLQSMLLTGMEYIGDVGEFTIDAPKDGGIYYGYFSDWAVTVTRGTPTRITVTTRGDTFDLQSDGHGWRLSWPIPIGSHHATVKATFSDGSIKEHYTLFWVKHWREAPTQPEPGIVYTQTPPLSIDCGLSADSVHAVSVTVGDQQVSLSGADDQFTGSLPNLAAGTYQAVFRIVQDGAARAFDTVVGFTVSGAGS